MDSQFSFTRHCKLNSILGAPTVFWFKLLQRLTAMGNNLILF